VWAWIVLAVGLVLCMVITLWVVQAGKTTVVSFSDQEVVHTVAVRFSDRWSQAPGPPNDYRSQALKAVQSGDLPEAIRLTSMTLALDPNSVGDWLQMICLSCLKPGAPFALTVDERHGLLVAMENLESPPNRIESALALHRESADSKADIDDGARFLSRCIDATIPSEGVKTKQETLDTLDVSP